MTGRRNQVAALIEAGNAEALAQPHHYAEAVTCLSKALPRHKDFLADLHTCSADILPLRLLRAFLLGPRDAEYTSLEATLTVIRDAKGSAGDCVRALLGNDGQNRNAALLRRIVEAQRGHALPKILLPPKAKVPADEAPLAEDTPDDLEWVILAKEWDRACERMREHFARLCSQPSQPSDLRDTIELLDELYENPIFGPTLAERINCVKAHFDVLIQTTLTRHDRLRVVEKSVRKAMAERRARVSKNLAVDTFFRSVEQQKFFAQQYAQTRAGPQWVTLSEPERTELIDAALSQLRTANGIDPKRKSRLSRTQAQRRYRAKRKSAISRPNSA